MSEAYGLIGHPLGHSMSPFLHKALFALGGKDASYRLLDLAPETMEQQVQDMTGYLGWNVTIPYKERIIPLLDRLDPSAARYNAVNCVRREPDGTLTGYNTDCTGFLHAVRDFSLGGRVLLLGCGGAGRMMATEAAMAGAQLTIGVRNPEKPELTALAAHLREAYPAAGVQLLPFGEISGDFDLLLNSTPVGMFPHTAGCPVPDAVIRRCGAVFDAIYNPEQTRLMELARQAGIPTVGGMDMLVQQAACAQEIWYGAQFSEADLAALTRQAQAQLARQEAHP